MKQRYFVRQSIGTRRLRYLPMVYDNQRVKCPAQITAIQQALILVSILSSWRYPDQDTILISLHAVGRNNP